MFKRRKTMAPPSLENLLRNIPQLSQTQLNALQEWIQQQPYLPHLDVLDLIPMLCYCDYNVEEAKELVVKYLTVRTHAPEIFKFRDPRSPNIRDQMEFIYYAVVGKDLHGNSVVCAGFTSKNPKTFNAEIVTYLGITYIEVMIRNEPSCPGYVFVVDTANFTSGHLTQFSLSLVKKILTFLEDAMTAHIATLHVVRLTPFADKFLGLVMPFLPKPWREKLCFHRKNLERLHAVVPKSVLPEDFGGFLPVTEYFYEEYCNQVLENLDWLNSLDTHVIDEKSRPGGAKSSRDVFGILGSDFFKRRGKN